MKDEKKAPIAELGTVKVMKRLPASDDAAHTASANTLPPGRIGSDNANKPESGNSPPQAFSGVTAGASSTASSGRGSGPRSQQPRAAW